MANKPQYPQREETVAAPPDAGGHLGSQSRPQDTLQTTHPASSDPAAYPPLHRDAPRHREGWRGALIAFIMIALLVLVLVAFGGWIF